MAAQTPTEVLVTEIVSEIGSTSSDNMKDSASQPTAKMDKAGKKDKNKDKEEGRVQFCNKDWQLLLDNNLDAVKGTEKSTRVGMKYPTKRTAFDNLAKHINENQFKGSTLVKLNWEAARNRYNYLGLLYKKAKEAIASTGWGLTETDVAKGIRTLEDKIDKICPCYERVNSIFGGTPRTNLKGNTLVSALTGELDEQILWNASRPISVADVGESFEEVAEEEDCHILDETEAHDIAMEGLQQSTPTPMSASQTPLPVPVSPAPPLAREDPPAKSAIDVDQRTTPAKSKSKQQVTYPNKKKHGSDKGQSLTGAFSSGMESISSKKAKANEITERAYELRYQSLQANRKLRFQSLQADRALHSDTTERKLALEAERLSIEKLKVNNNILATRLEATMKIVNENQGRKPEEVPAILAAFTTSLPPML